MAITLLGGTTAIGGGGVRKPKVTYDNLPSRTNPGVPPPPQGGAIPYGGLSQATQAATSTTETNPWQKESYERQRTLLDQLGKNEDAAATNALARGRDVIAGQLADVRSSAGARGFNLGTGLNESLQGQAALSGAQSLAQQNVDLADSARRLQLGGEQALGGLGTGIAGAQTSQYSAAQNAINQQQALQLQQWQAIQDALNQQWQQQYQLYQNPNYKPVTNSTVSRNKGFNVGGAPAAYNARPISIVAAGGPSGGMRLG